MKYMWFCVHFVQIACIFQTGLLVSFHFHMPRKPLNCLSFSMLWVTYMLTNKIFTSLLSATYVSWKLSFLILQECRIKSQQNFPWYHWKSKQEWGLYTGKFEEGEQSFCRVCTMFLENFWLVLRAICAQVLYICIVWCSTNLSWNCISF